MGDGHHGGDPLHTQCNGRSQTLGPHTAGQHLTGITQRDSRGRQGTAVVRAGEGGMGNRH